MICKKCQIEMNKNGWKYGKQQYICKVCGSTARSNEDVAEEKETSIGLSEADLRSRHDIKFMIVAAAESLKVGRYITNSEFVQYSGIRAGMGYRETLDHPDFDKYKGKAGGVIYWSHPESIKKLKMEGVLR